MTSLTTKTGLRIGCLAPKAPPPHHDADALRLQDALLGNARRTDWDGLAIIVGTMAAIGVVAWGLA